MVKRFLLFLCCFAGVLCVSLPLGGSNSLESGRNSYARLLICGNEEAVSCVSSQKENLVRKYRVFQTTLLVLKSFDGEEEGCRCASFPVDSAENEIYLVHADSQDGMHALTSFGFITLTNSIVAIDDDAKHFFLVSTPKKNEVEFDRMSTKLEKQRINVNTVSQKAAAGSSSSSLLSKSKENKLNLKDRKMIVDDEKDDILASISATEYADIIRRLSGDLPITVPSGSYTLRTRHSSTQDNIYAAEYIYEYLNDLGYDTYYEYFRCQSGYDTQNIIGIKQGTTVSDEVVVVGGHMDSTSPQTNNAPGAIDNASGADGMMVIARAFQNVSLARTVYFMGFGCEEQGLIGSEYFIENTDENVVSALTMDMIAYSNQYYGVMIEGLPNADVQNLMTLMEDNCEQYSSRLTTTTRNFSFGSDHVSFQNAGVPAFLAIEQDETDYNCYHATCDTVANANSNQGSDIARAMAGVLYDVAKFE